MKKTALLAFLLALIMVLPCFCGVAAKSETEADKLNALGLFAGTDKGYELTRTPTRAEAAVMLVRFFGKEKVAKQQYANATVPFTDVPQWALPYVAYLYENGLTVGISKTAYGTDTTCSLQMYCAFMLRAIGYSDKNGDFEYANSCEFALAKDILTPANKKASFDRGVMVSISVKALTVPTADYHYEMLAFKLAREGVITEAQAVAIKSELQSKQLKLGFIGDSLTWSGCCTNQDEDSYPAWVTRWLGTGFMCRNFGQGGATYGYSTIDNAYEYYHVSAYQKSKDFQPNLTLIMFGTNDSCYYSGSSVKSMVKDAKKIIGTYTGMKSYKLAAICSAPYCPQQGSAIQQNINPAVEAMAESLNLPYINTFDATHKNSISYDNVHFTDKGYILLAQAIFRQYAEILVENGIMDREVADAKVKYANLEASAALKKERIPDEGNDEEKLVTLAKQVKPTTSEPIKFVCSDFDSSGPIYAITESLYGALSLTRDENDFGWRRVGVTNMKIGTLSVATYGAPGSTSYFDVYVYAKKIEDCYFIWFDNFYGFSDVDGFMKDGVTTFKYGRGNGVQIDMHFTNPDAEIGNREVSFVCRDTDKTGNVYSISDRMANEWKYIDGYDVVMGGVTWKRVDTFGMYFNISYYDWGHLETHKGCHRDKNINMLEWLYGTEYYVAEVNGQHYMWERYSDNYGADFNSDRITINWPVETENGTVMRASTYYRYTTVIHDSSKYKIPTTPFNLK